MGWSCRTNGGGGVCGKLAKRADARKVDGKRRRGR